MSSEEFKRILHGGSAIYIILQIYSPANLIKLFTSLAPNYVHPAIRGSSINRPASLNRVQPTQCHFSLQNGPTDADKELLRLTSEDFTPSPLQSDISYCPGVLLTFEEHREEKGNFITGSTQSGDNGLAVSKWCFQGKLPVVVISRAELALLTVSLKDKCR